VFLYKKIIFIAIFLALLSCPIYSRAQQHGDTTVVQPTKQKTSRDFTKPVVRMRANVTGLMDFFDANISLGAEYQWNPRNAMIIDVAYIFYTMYAGPRTATNVGGFYIRPTYRHYLGKTQTAFLEGTFMYKNVSSTNNTWVGVNPVQGIPSFEVLRNVRSARNIYSISSQIGGILSLNKQSSFRLEGWVGIGLRYRTYKPLLAANEILRPTEGRAPLVDYDSGWRLTIPAGFRLAFSW
jgi:hypothetical protein